MAFVKRMLFIAVGHYLQLRDLIPATNFKKRRIEGELEPFSRTYADLKVHVIDKLAARGLTVLLMNAMQALT